MLLYSVIMFVVAGLILAIGISISRGNTKLIHDYHQTKVKETQRLDYAKAFAKGLFVLGAALALSGGLALLGDSKGIRTASLIVLFVGIAGSIAILLKVQKTYNRGLF